MKQVKTIALLMCTSILLCACPKESGHHYITLSNMSGKRIACQALWSGSITNADTLLQCRIGAVGIDANSSYKYSSLSADGGWKSDFEVIPYLQLLILDGDIYDKYLATPCDTIRKYVPILYRYQFKLEDLERMNWTIVYPPKE